MTENQAKKIQSNTGDVPPDPIAANNPATKPVNLDASYKHAIPKDSDPWMTLLTPELEADTLRCNAWKDEVQNLLIFAGLFSAVVTAFVIESYKFLLPDPNDAIAGLLFHIASSLNNTSPFPPSVSSESILTPFSRTSFAIRVNIVWFTSLILSLTTVLVGTIALQWLREHQSYGGYSNKEKLAMLHMRSQAIEAWYLPQVFTTLPLLLQAALVLFLVGLIDFSSPLGSKLTITVSIVVGLTLLFFAATTTLPSFQGLSFFCGFYPRKTLPTPCPFKSPQAHAFRTLFRIFFREVFHIFPSPQLSYIRTSPDNYDTKPIIHNRSLLIPDHLVPPVRSMWNQRTWLTLDREWLSLRDACHQRILDADRDLYIHRTHWENNFPLCDATQHLVEVVEQPPGLKHTNAFLAASVHCFNELAESIWTAPNAMSNERKDRRNNYFELLIPNSSDFCSLSKFLFHGGTYKFDQLSAGKIFNYTIRREVNTRLFSTDLTYRRELWLRVLHLSVGIAPLIPTITDDFESSPIPTIIEWSAVYSMLNDNLRPDEQFSNAANILVTIFESAASHRVSEDQSMASLCAYPQTGNEVLDLLASQTDIYLKWSRMDTPTTHHVRRDVDDRFIKLFKFISDHLNEEQTNPSSNSQKASLDLLFYFSSIFIWHLLYWKSGREILDNRDSSLGGALRSLLDALHKTWISGEKNDLLEERFSGEDNELPRFSDKWWNQIFKRIGHCIIEQDTASDTLRQLESMTFHRQDETEDPNNPMSATSPASLYHSPASNTLGIDDQLATTHLDSLPVTSRQEPVSNLVNQADESISYSPSDSPDIQNHSTPSSEGTDRTRDLPLSISQHLPDGPNKAHPSGGDHTTVGVARPIHQPLPSSSAADPNGVVPHQAIRNGTSHSDGRDLQPSGFHLAIDVESPTSPERVESEIPGAGSNH